MRIPYTFFLTICFSFLTAQAVLVPADSTGGAYAVISAAGFNIEGPDDSSRACAGNGPGNHSAFGDHVTQAYDSFLQRNVFVFHSHIDEDNDRCVVFDRARMEIKGGPAGNSDAELEHAYGDTTYYRWQFRLAEDFVGASSFTHLFQSKAAGGTDSSFPILTLTARQSRVELLHNGGDENPSGSLEAVATASLDPFRGKWVEVFLRQVHTNSGSLTAVVTDVATGLPIMLFDGDDIDLWRGPDNDASVINRPKWGIYRSYNETAGLQDEQVRFAQFCVSESDGALCPSLINLGGTLAAVNNALPLDGSEDVPLTMPLVWDAVPGATAYRVYLGTSPTELSLDTMITANLYYPGFAAGTTYYYQIGSVNDDGETRNDVQQFTTLLNADDGAWKIARGHAAPHIEAPQNFELNTNLTMVGLDSTARIPADGGNNAYCWFSGPKEDGNGNYRWRHRQLSTEEVTLVLRLRALPDVNNISFIELYGLGWRQKLRINRSTIKVEKTADDPEFAFPDGYWDDGAYHVIRVTFAADPAGGPMLTTVYLDENPVPFIDPLPSDEEKSGGFLDVGRAGSTNYGACLDFIAIKAGGAYPPESGPEAQVPPDLAGDAPVAVSQTLPLESSVDVPLSMPLIWDPVVGVDSFRVYLGTSSDALVADTTLAGNIHYPELLAGTTYYYQIGSLGEGTEARSPVRQFTTLTDADDGAWEVARGHARPDLEAPQLFEFNTNLVMVGIDSVAAQEDGNNAYCWFSGPKEDGNGNYRWRNRMGDGQETTLVLRLRALPDNNNITYIEFYGLGWRQKLRINRSTLKVEKTTDDPEIAFPDGFWDDGAYHVIRVTFANNPTGGPMLTTIYLDEHAFPFGGTSYPSDEEKDGSYLDVGRAGGTNYGACIDYIAVNPTGLFAPGADAASLPPADLILPDATVSTPSFAALPAPTLYPNPVGAELLLKDVPAVTGKLTYRIYSGTGRQVLTGQLAAGVTRAGITVSALVPGMYLLELRSDRAERTVARFIKR